MKRKRIRCIVYLSFTMMLSSCFTRPDKDVVNEINLIKWNQQTISMLKSECYIDSFNYDNPNNPPNGLLYDGKVFYKVEDHVLYMLEWRVKFLEALRNKDLELNKQILKVIELYQKKEPTLIVLAEDSNYYSLNFKDQNTNEFTIKKTDTYADWFNDTNKFVNSMDVNLKGMWITTIFEKTLSDSVLYNINSITVF